MNIHPIFVHFPVALLTVYAVFELMRFKKIREKEYWFYVKAVILFAGTLGAFTALSTGESAEHALTDRTLRPLVEIHSTFATVSTWIFVLLTLAYLVVWFEKTQCFSGWIAQHARIQKIWNLKKRIAHTILDTPIAPTVAFLGLVAITITGSLGGAIVYGPNVDPIVNYIYHLFF